jgi:hypothetical protein
MSYLADTNVIARWVRPGDPDYALAQSSVLSLHKVGETIYVTPQNIIEFRAIATRPVANRGFGMTPGQAKVEADTILNFFPLLPDPPHFHTLVCVGGQIRGYWQTDARYPTRGCHGSIWDQSPSNIQRGGFQKVYRNYGGHPRQCATAISRARNQKAR